MVKSWQDLMKLTAGKSLIVERVRIVEDAITIEGQFELPSLAKLAYEDQVFVSAFAASHGSIKQMEKLFGVSYPTIKNRLNAIAEKLDFVEINLAQSKSEILEQIDKGELSVDEALEKLKER